MIVYYSILITVLLPIIYLCRSIVLLNYINIIALKHTNRYVYNYLINHLIYYMDILHLS